MEIVPKTVSVHDKGCTGCVYHKKDVMVVISHMEPIGDYIASFVDIFLTEEQAWRLAEDLIDKLKQNKQ